MEEKELTEMSEDLVQYLKVLLEELAVAVTAYKKDPNEVTFANMSELLSNFKIFKEDFSTSYEYFKGINEKLRSPKLKRSI